MEFPDLMQEKEKLTRLFYQDEDIHGKTVRVIASPYRICPLGAHIDHQGGSVLGMTINAFTLMAFSPIKSGDVRLRSRNYPGRVAFNIADITESTGSFWGVYPRAAVLALQEKYTIKHGFTGIVDGMLPGGGLSSSASVLLAYLYALADANSLEIEPWEFVHLTHQAEKNYIGLNNGILDQTSILFGKKGCLLHIDTKGEKVIYLADGPEEDQYRIIVAFSGYSRELTTSGYNSRVSECQMAAQKLSQLAGRAPASLLSGVSQEDFDRFGAELEINLAKRSTHYFTESQRVIDGVTAWQNCSIETFGRLMNASCRSSMEQYECGIQPICDLQQIVSTTEGVLGSRFMGGGFGGCVVGLVQPDHAAVAIKNIKESYQKLHPEVSEQANVYLARSGDGVRFI